jgi:ADP-ribose pyrophosphatase
MKEKYMSLNNPTLNCDYPTRPIVAVGAVVFHNNRVLLVKRSNPPGKGYWTLPGGKVEMGETLQQAVEREILEETGIRIKTQNFVDIFDMIEYGIDNRIRFHYVIIDFFAEYIDGVPKAADDASAAGWISAEAMLNLSVNFETRRILRDKFEFGL